MNLFIQVYCIATILTKHWMLANLVQDYRIQNEGLRVAVAFDNIVSSDFLPVAPGALLGVIFNTAEVSLGNNIPPARTIRSPCFIYEDADPGTNYTIIVLNTNYQSRVANVDNFLVYLNINNDGSDFGSSTNSSTGSCTGLCTGSSTNLSTGSCTGLCPGSSTGFIVAPWIGPAARPGSGPYSVIALVYKQDCFIEPYDQFLIESTYFGDGFDLPEFVNYYNLTGPIAGNFWTFYVPEDYCKLCNNDTL